MIFATLACLPAHAAPRDWPALIGGADAPQCAQAFELAQQAFASDAFYLHEPIATPANFPSRIVLQRERLDISGGDALVVDRAVFERVPFAGPGSSMTNFARLHRQRTPHNGYRVVVRAVQHGWRGDVYDVFVLPAEADTESLFRLAEVSPHAIPVDGWDPPLVLRDGQAGGLWFIATSRHHMADWTVHRVDASATEPQCAVRFHAADDRLLPQPVLELAAHVDATLGDGRNEGTLHSTARHRLFTEYLHWNAALRPWAITDAMYNTRAQVDAALRAWARQGPTFQAAHEALIAQYPLARDALAGYYQENFELSAEQARVQAAFVLDVAYRAPFVFRGGGGAGTPSRPANPNPWPTAAQRHAR